MRQTAFGDKASLLKAFKTSAPRAGVEFVRFTKAFHRDLSLACVARGAVLAESSMLVEVQYVILVRSGADPLRSCGLRGVLRNVSGGVTCASSEERVG
jgi:hypothetical protein